MWSSVALCWPPTLTSIICSQPEVPPPGQSRLLANIPVDINIWTLEQARPFVRARLTTLPWQPCPLRSFASVCHLQKEQKDAEQLIQSLTSKLSMPLEEDPKPPPGPDPDPDPDPDPSPPAGKVKLLLVLQKQKMDLTAENGEHPKNVMTSAPS